MSGRQHFPDDDSPASGVQTTSRALLLANSSHRRTGPPGISQPNVPAMSRVGPVSGTGWLQGDAITSIATIAPERNDH
ncbi:MAG: hypothetical protein L0H23_12960, partial [Luteimonas sp.]|nr:hypothetical protein [Luteimonas sp.]